eukprot:sb/3478887/
MEQHSLQKITGCFEVCLVFTRLDYKIIISNSPKSFGSKYSYQRCKVRYGQYNLEGFKVDRRHRVNTSKTFSFEFTNPNTDWHHFPTAKEKLPKRERG